MNSSINNVQITSLSIKDFRCFTHLDIELNNAIVLIYGLNGTGKTSLLEALYYACYMRSFRTHNARDLIAFNKASFFIQLTINDSSSVESMAHTINVGFADNKRLVKINSSVVVSYKDLLSYYRVVSLTEDDLTLIKGNPEERRAFIDKALLLHNPHFIAKMREFRAVLEQRNALLTNNRHTSETYDIWTQKLWEHSNEIQIMRKEMLNSFETEINMMLKDRFDHELAVTFSYQAKKQSDLPLKAFLAHNGQLSIDEHYFKRSLFGVHLDDFLITFEGKKSRAFASRGQQKMIALLLKAAQIKQLMRKQGSVVFLLDDFMTDFDAERSALMLSVLLELNCQLIFTSPHANNPLENTLKASQKTYQTITI